MARRSTDAGCVSIARRKKSDRREVAGVGDRGAMPGLAVASIAAPAVATGAGRQAPRRLLPATVIVGVAQIEVAALAMAPRRATSGTTGAAAEKTAVAGEKTEASGVVGEAVGGLGVVAKVAVRRAVASTTSTTSTEPR